MLLVNAHLDTVFPEGTDVNVRRQGTRLMAPGVGDDTRGLAAILALIRALDAAQIQTRPDILLPATSVKLGNWKRYVVNGFSASSRVIVALNRSAAAVTLVGIRTPRLAL